MMDCFVCFFQESVELLTQFKNFIITYNRTYSSQEGKTQIYNPIQKLGVSRIFCFFLKEINYFIEQECIGLIKSVIILQNIYISNKCCSSDYLFIKKILKNVSRFTQKYEAAQLFSTLVKTNIS